jgi:pimeloyl-ACP methyl ester carboxylesterase
MSPLFHRFAHDRRRFLGGAAMTLLATQLGPTGAARAFAASDQTPTPTGPGAVSGAPNLPAGFATTFASRYVQAGDVRLHAVVGGDGPPLLLIHGWPQTWYAWRMVMAALAQDFTIVAPDQRGIGLSDKPADGYDTGTLAGDMVALMAALGHDRFALYGTDVGMPIAYALAADHPERVARLAVSEAPIPGVSPSPPLFVPSAVNERLWHIAFNRCAAVNERLVKGREDVFFGNEYAVSAATPLPADVVAYYVAMLRSDEYALRGSFGFYRAIDTTTAQNQERAKHKLTLPVLAIGGEHSTGAGIGKTMQLAADDVQTVVLLAALIPFLAPYKGTA